MFIYQGLYLFSTNTNIKQMRLQRALDVFFQLMSELSVLTLVGKRKAPTGAWFHSAIHRLLGRQSIKRKLDFCVNVQG